MENGKLKDELEEIKKLQKKIEKDFLENEREIAEIESGVKDLEILDQFAKAIKKVDTLKREAEVELGSSKSDVKVEKVNFEKRI